MAGINVKAGSGVVLQGKALVRDADGNPVVDRKQLKKFWKFLSKKDKDHLKAKYEDIDQWL